MISFLFHYLFKWQIFTLVTRYIFLQRRFDLQVLQIDGELSFLVERSMEGDARDCLGVLGDL